MDLDQHTAHVTRALDQRLHNNFRLGRSRTHRHIAAADLVNEIRLATEELLAEQQAAAQRTQNSLNDELIEAHAVIATLRDDLGVATATAHQEAKTVQERDWLIQNLQAQLAALHRTAAPKVPEWSEAAREPATAPEVAPEAPRTAAKPRTPRTASKETPKRQRGSQGRETGGAA